MGNGLPILPLLQGRGQPLSRSYFIMETAHLAKSNKEIKFLKVSFVLTTVRTVFWANSDYETNFKQSVLSKLC